MGLFIQSTGLLGTFHPEFLWVVVPMGDCSGYNLTLVEQGDERPLCFSVQSFKYK